MAATVAAGGLLTWNAAGALPRGEDARQAASMANYVASEGAVDVVQMHGGYGDTTKYPAERLYRDAEVTAIYEGTTEVGRNVVAQSLLE